MSTTDYLTALENRGLRTPQRHPRPSPWDPNLTAEMTTQGRAAVEERLIPTLLPDLAS